MSLITVCICTHNRAELLRELIESLRPQKDIEKAEVIVVDNNCTDHTSEVVKSFYSAFPNIRWVSEPKPGLSHARNRGMEESTADYIAYLDDDAICEQGWLHAMIVAFQTANADAVGGKIVPYWKGSKPWWVSKALYVFLSGNDHGDEIIAETDVEPYGGNMAYRTSLLRELGGFDVELGMKSVAGTNKTQFLGEETQLVSRLRQAGGSVAYAGGAVIRHLTDGPMSTYRGVRKRADMMALTSVQINAENIDIQAVERQWTRFLGNTLLCVMTARPKLALMNYLMAAMNGKMLAELLVRRDIKRNRLVCLANGIRSGTGLAIGRLTRRGKTGR